MQTDHVLIPPCLDMVKSKPGLQLSGATGRVIYSSAVLWPVLSLVSGLGVKECQQHPANLQPPFLGPPAGTIAGTAGFVALSANFFLSISSTFFTLPKTPACTPAPALQSSGRYGLPIRMASRTMMFVPSHLVGSVLAIASKISCASLPTPLPFLASASFSLATAASARDCKVEVERDDSGGFADVKGVDEEGARESSVNDWIAVMGSMW